LVQSSGVVTLAKVNCFLVLSFHLSLFVSPQFALLLDWDFLAFQRPFFLLAVGSQIFLFLSAAAIFSAELFLVLCLWSRHHHRHHHHHFHAFVVQ
jgi:ABC-type transport system involved in cytochrome c biogenesis permease component